MRRVVRWGMVCLLLLAACPAAGTVLVGRPTLAVAIESSSMEPALRRGDLVLIQAVTARTDLRLSEIVVFRRSGKQAAGPRWAVHRLVGRDEQGGFITKGDANPYPDQGAGGEAPVRIEDIAAKAVTFRNHPVRLPLLGYLPILARDRPAGAYLAGAFVCLLAAALPPGRRPSRRRRPSVMPTSAWCLTLSLAATVILGACMLGRSSLTRVRYEVCEQKQEVIVGGTPESVRVGERVVRPFARLQNRGFLPLLVVIDTDDPNLSFHEPHALLTPGESRRVTVTIAGNNSGTYSSAVRVGVFLPVLPLQLLRHLAATRFWLALVCAAAAPSLPVALLGLTLTRERTRLARRLRRFRRRLASL